MDTRIEETLKSEAPLTQADIFKRLSEIDKLFIKPRSHFGSEQALAIPGGEGKASHHVATLCNKKYKSSSSQQRNVANWVNIKNNYLIPETKENIYKIIVAAGEIYQFEIGDTQPKYRIMNNDKQLTLLSKEIKQGREFYDYYAEDIYPHLHYSYLQSSDFSEGMGRVALTRYIYLADDFHFGNAYIDGNNNFVGIDFDSSFWPVTQKYHHSSSPYKQVGYIPSSHYTTTPSPHNPNFLKVDSQLADYMGIMHVEDYDNFPILKYHLPTNWEFMNPAVTTYAARLAKDERFLNEKHLTALKALITPLVKELLIHIHCKDEDKKPMMDMVNERLTGLADILKESAVFLEYFKKHRSSFVYIIFYEMNHFLKTNKHYHLKNPSEQNALWKLLTENTIQEFKKLLTKFSCVELSNAGEIELNQQAIKVRDNVIDSHNHAGFFYHNQKMRNQCTAAWKISAELRLLTKRKAPSPDEKPTVEEAIPEKKARAFP